MERRNGDNPIDLVFDPFLTQQRMSRVCAFAETIEAHPAGGRIKDGARLLHRVHGNGRVAQFCRMIVERLFVKCPVRPLNPIISGCVGAVTASSLPIPPGRPGWRAAC